MTGRYRISLIPLLDNGIPRVWSLRSGRSNAGIWSPKPAGHSLRAGHATSAAIAGASERSIMNQTRHRSVQMVRRYIRGGSLFRENSAGKLGCSRNQRPSPSCLISADDTRLGLQSTFH